MTPLQRRSLGIVVPALAAVAFGHVSLAADPPPPSFRGLGFFPGTGTQESQGSDVSGNGSTVVGYSSDTATTNNQAFRWNTSEGFRGLGARPLGIESTRAQGVSGDGSVIVGIGRSAGGVESAIRWTPAGGTVRLPELPADNPASAAYAVSGDGLTAAGWSASNGGPQAARWTGAGVAGLGFLTGATGDSLASATNADGSVVAGYSSSPRGRYEAFRWTPAGGMAPLGDLAGGAFESAAFGASADGSVVVGYSLTAAGREAFRWTEATGMVNIGDLKYGEVDAVARAASADGNIIVGFSDGGRERFTEAFLWNKGHMLPLQDELGYIGVSTEGWHLAEAFGVSDDGLTISGWGINPQGQLEAFVAVIPEPTSLSLLVVAALATLRRRRQ